ncbi:MAG: putative sugar nucleotidyl transferase [Gemmatimonadales bacterium]|nr:putative sugar nucleotidyl transferase [Gemmatimonadales bacterium]
MTAAPALLLLDPPHDAPAWAPFARVRPVAELRAGALAPHERWARRLGTAPAAGVHAPGLDGPPDPDGLALLGAAELAGPAWVARSDVAVALGAAPAPATRCLTLDGEAVAWRLAAGERWPDAMPGGPAEAVDGVRLRGAWDLVTALERLLGADVEALRHDGGGLPLPRETLVIGDATRVLVRSDRLEPGIVLDVRGGDIVVEAGAEVRHGTRLEGPCWIGADCRIVGGPIRHAAIGPKCTVRGELSTSTFLGFANKAHDGFVGHSVIGAWVNLGAGTTTSNLKNTYGEVRVDVAPGERLPTGRQFLGTLFADHAKTAIGTMLPTGSLVGCGANVVSDGRPPKQTAPFTWDEGSLMTAEGFVRIAERVLPRRGVAVTPARRAALLALHARLASRP